MKLSFLKEKKFLCKTQSNKGGKYIASLASVSIQPVYFQILSALQLSGSLMLLEFLISIFCRETQHVHEDEIQNALDKFIRRYKDCHQHFILLN